MKKLLKYEGPLSLWRGLTPSLLMQVPASGFYYTTYDLLKQKLLKRSSIHQGYHLNAIAGLTARCLAVTLTVPMEFIRTSIQASSSPSIGIIKVVKTAIRHRGIKSLWTGLGPTLLRDAPFSAIYWALFEYFRNSFSKIIISPPVLHFASGALAGSIAAAVTTPIDVVKTRMQASMGKRNIKYLTTLSSIKFILKEEGFKGFLKGLGPRISKVAPSCAIMITSYEMFKELFLSI